MDAGNIHTVAEIWHSENKGFTSANYIYRADREIALSKCS